MGREPVREDQLWGVCRQPTLITAAATLPTLLVVGAVLDLLGLELPLQLPSENQQPRPNTQVYTSINLYIVAVCSEQLAIYWL